MQSVTGVVTNLSCKLDELTCNIAGIIVVGIPYREQYTRYTCRTKKHPVYGYATVSAHRMNCVKCQDANIKDFDITSVEHYF